MYYDHIMTHISIIVSRWLKRNNFLEIINRRSHVDEYYNIQI